MKFIPFFVFSMILLSSEWSANFANTMAIDNLVDWNNIHPKHYRNQKLTEQFNKLEQLIKLSGDQLKQFQSPSYSTINDYSEQIRRINQQIEEINRRVEQQNRENEQRLGDANHAVERENNQIIASNRDVENNNRDRVSGAQRANEIINNHNQNRNRDVDKVNEEIRRINAGILP